MDVREKLVELICRFCSGLSVSDITPPYGYENLADFLISNGVTVQETGHWVTLTDCSNEGVYCSVCHKKVYRNYYALCNRKNKLRSDYCPHCGAKMMPQPPKGE